MKISKSTRHYRRFEYWRDHTAAGRKHRVTQIIKRDEYGMAVFNEGSDDYAWETVPGKPVSLCKYFWVVALRAPARMAYDWFLDRPIAAYSFVLGIFVAALLILGWLAPTPWWQPLVFMLAGVALGALGLAVVGAGFWLSDWYKSRRTTKPSIVAAARQSLAAEFVKSKKRKVCPLIEFEDA